MYPSLHSNVCWVLNLFCHLYQIVVAFQMFAVISSIVLFVLYDIGLVKFPSKTLCLIFLLLFAFLLCYFVLLSCPCTFNGLWILSFRMEMNMLYSIILWYCKQSRYYCFQPAGLSLQIRNSPQNIVDTPHYSQMRLVLYYGLQYSSRPVDYS